MTDLYVEHRCLTRSGKIARKPWLVTDGREVVSRHRYKGEAEKAASQAVSA